MSSAQEPCFYSCLWPDGCCGTAETSRACHLQMTRSRDTSATPSTASPEPSAARYARTDTTAEQEVPFILKAFWWCSVLMKNRCWIKQCVKVLQTSPKISECYKAELFALLWPVFFLFIYVIWLLFNRAVVSHWISIKKSTFYNYENVFFVLFDYQVNLKLT